LILRRISRASVITSSRQPRICAPIDWNIYAPTFDIQDHKAPTAELLLSLAASATDVRRFDLQQPPVERLLSPSLWHFSQDQNPATRGECNQMQRAGALKPQKRAQRIFRHTSTLARNVETRSSFLNAQQQQPKSSYAISECARCGEKKAGVGADEYKKGKRVQRRDSIFTLSPHTPQGAARMTCKTALAWRCQNHPEAYFLIKFNPETSCAQKPLTCR
jgi:hypothetical protein